MRVLALGCLVNQDETDHATFRSATSLLDYDVVIWDPLSTIDEYRLDPFNNMYRGLPSLSENDSARIVEDIARRRGEFSSMLELGRTLIIFGAGPQRCYVYTGQQTISGTGRNAKVTNFVNDIDVLAALPFAMTTVAATGTQMQLRAGEPYAQWWQRLRPGLQYRAYFAVKDAADLAVVEGTDRVVASALSVGRGVVLIVPALSWRTSDQIPGQASNEAVVVDAFRSLLDALREQTGDFKLPDWAVAYGLPDERAHLEELRSREVERDALLKRIDEGKAAVATLTQRKILFTGSGVALESQVREAFAALGFDVSPGAPGRDDFIATRGNDVAVIEVKGVSKSAAEKHAAQLEKWVSGYYEANGRQPKGILVVNTFAQSRLEQRTAPDFPDQMLPYSKGRGHALVTGLQLLGAWLDAEAHPDRRDEIAGSLLSAVGIWERYAEWREFLTVDDGGTTQKAISEKDAG